MKPQQVPKLNKCIFSYLESGSLKYYCPNDVESSQKQICDLLWSSDQYIQTESCLPKISVSGWTCCRRVGKDEAGFGFDTQFDWKSLYYGLYEDLQLVPIGSLLSDQWYSEISRYLRTCWTETHTGLISYNLTRVDPPTHTTTPSAATAYPLECMYECVYACVSCWGWTVQGKSMWNKKGLGTLQNL